MADFTERFNELLDQYRGNDTDLAKALDVSKQTISAWRSGTRSPKKQTVTYIAHYFNVNIEWLMGCDVERDTFYPAFVVSFDGLPALDTITDEERLLIRAYREASPEYQNVVLEILTNHKKED